MISIENNNLQKKMKRIMPILMDFASVADMNSFGKN